MRHRESNCLSASAAVITVTAALMVDKLMTVFLSTTTSSSCSSSCFLSIAPLLFRRCVDTSHQIIDSRLHTIIQLWVGARNKPFEYVHFPLLLLFLQKCLKCRESFECWTLRRWVRVNDCSRRRRRRPPPRRLLGDCCCVYLDDYRHQQTVLSLSVSVSVSVCVCHKRASWDCQNDGLDFRHTHTHEDMQTDGQERRKRWKWMRRCSKQRLRLREEDYITCWRLP